MELRHLKYFGTVADYGSFSKAATALSMTQPSLSRQIIELENELEHELFKRSPRGVTLTPAGVGLYQHSEVVLAQIARIPEIIQTSSRNQQLVRIGVPQGLPHEWFLSLLEAVKDEQPELSVSLNEATTRDQQQLLHNGLIDLAVLHTSVPYLRSVEVLSQRIGLALPWTSPLAERPELRFRDLAGLRIMAHESGAISVEESHLRAETTKSGIDVDWVFRQFSEHSNLIAVAAEVDAVLVTEASARRHLEDWSWVPLRSRDADGRAMMVRTFLTWKEPEPPYLAPLVATMSAAAARTSA